MINCHQGLMLIVNLTSNDGKLVDFCLLSKAMAKLLCLNP